MGSCPFQVRAPGVTRADPRGPRHRQLLFSASGGESWAFSSWVPRRAGRRGAERRGAPGRKAAPRGLRALRGDSGVESGGRKRPQEGLDPEAAERQKRPGEQGVGGGWGRRGCGMKKALGFGRAERKGA